MRLINGDKIIRNLKKWSNPTVADRNNWCIQIIEGEETVKAIPIPDNATNGDMIKDMFPNAIIEINEIGSMVHVKYNNHTCWVNYELDWWNAPYKEV